MTWQANPFFTLQCHFGVQTLSLAHMGAKVSGIDFSSESIALARDLSRELGLEAELICGDVLDSRALLDGDFDIVFASYGSVGEYAPERFAWHGREEQIPPMFSVKAAR